MSEIADFLRARYEERRALAEAATPGEWRAEPCIYGSGEGWGAPHYWEIKAGEVDVVAHQTYEGGGIDVEANARHIAANDPADVIADCEVKLALVDLAERTLASAEGDSEVDYYGALSATEETLCLLARPFAEHPDHKSEEWAP